MPERAIVFVDGNNWFHALKNAGLTNLGQLNYAKVSRKILMGREWVATHYYVGQVRQEDNAQLYAAQRRAMMWLKARDTRIRIIYGRLEPRRVINDAAIELKEYLANLTIRIDRDVYRYLSALANRYERLTVPVEKAVDVNIAVDMVSMAINNEYDTAYLLSADGDFTPAVDTAMAQGKKIFAVSIEPGAKLAKSVHKFIRLNKDWFDECFGE